MWCDPCIWPFLVDNDLCLLLLKNISVVLIHGMLLYLTNLYFSLLLLHFIQMKRLSFYWVGSSVMFWESFWILMSWFWVLTSSWIINMLAHHFLARSLLIGIVSRDGAIRKEIQYVKSVNRLRFFPSHSWYFFFLSCLNLKLEAMSSLSHFLGVFTKLFSSTSQKQCNYGNWYKVILNMYWTNWFIYGFFIIPIFWKVLLKVWELCELRFSV